MVSRSFTHPEVSGFVAAGPFPEYSEIAFKGKIYFFIRFVIVKTYQYLNILNCFYSFKLYPDSLRFICKIKRGKYHFKVKYIL